MNLATVAQTPAMKSVGARLTGGRVSVALAEAKRRLEVELPPQIAYENARLALTGNARFLTPRNYGIAPTKETFKGAEMSVFVGATIRKEPLGTRAFKNIVALQVHLVGERGDGEKQVLGRYDLAEIIAATMHPYLTGCQDELGRWAWRELAPLDVTALPEDWKHLSGLTLNYQLFQWPTDDLWTPPT